MSKNLFYMIPLMVLFAVAGNALAGQVYSEWRGTTDSNWSTASNWSPAVVPVAYDPVGGPQAASFGKAGFKGTGGIVPVSPVIGVGTTVSVDQIVIGGGNGTGGIPVLGGGDLTLDGGTINVSEYLNIGNLKTSDVQYDFGTLTVNSGTLNMGVRLPVDGRLICGHNGTGYIVQNGGKINIKSFLTIADDYTDSPTTSKGFVSLLGGVMEISFGSGGTYLKMQGGTAVGDPNKSKIAITGGQLVFDTISAELSANLAAWVGSGQIMTPDSNSTLMVTCAEGKTSIWVMGNQQKFGNYDGLVNEPRTLQDSNDNDVTFTLKGGGYGTIDSTDPDFSDIILHDTTANSILTIKTQGKIKTSIGNITVGDTNDVNGLKSIVAKTANLEGDITVNGGLGTLTLGDADGHVTIGEYVDSSKNTAGVLIKFSRVSDLAIDSNLPIKKLTAIDWHGGSIDAPSIISSISITGNNKLLVDGDMDIDATIDSTVKSITVKGTLSGTWTCASIRSITAPDVNEVDITLSQPPTADPKVLALGKLTAKRTIDFTQIRSEGSIGTVSAGKMVDSSCFAGVTEVNDVNADDGVYDLPPVEDINSIDPVTTIKSITVKGIRGTDLDSFINSNIAASQILSVSLYYPQYDNNDVPFGLSADYIKKLKIKDENGTESWKTLPPNDFNDVNDFKVLHN